MDNADGIEPGMIIPLSPMQHITADSTRLVLEIQHELMTTVREFLSVRGFTELLMPVVGPVTDPGTRGSKQVDIDYYGHPYKLMTSAILYKQVSLLAFPKIFCLAPNVRLEPVKTAATHRHLAEFRQIDVEIAGATRAEAMNVAEALVSHVVRVLVRKASGKLRALGRDTEGLMGDVREPFRHMTHTDVVKWLADSAYDQNGAAEINWEAEEILSAKAASPFFIVDYPKGSRGFYDREDVARPGILKSFDLIAPDGYGELASGAERESEYAKIVTRMRETGENPAKYRWYLDIAKSGIPASAGFGIGIERLTRYVTGRSAVWECTAFPKLPGTAMP
jgi:asparaginyl-tRNA synthetase